MEVVAAAKRTAERLRGGRGDVGEHELPGHRTQPRRRPFLRTRFQTWPQRPTPPGLPRPARARRRPPPLGGAAGVAGRGRGGGKTGASERRRRRRRRAAAASPISDVASADTAASTAVRWHPAPAKPAGAGEADGGGAEARAQPLPPRARRRHAESPPRKARISDGTVAGETMQADDAEAPEEASPPRRPGARQEEARPSR